MKTQHKIKRETKRNTKHTKIFVAAKAIKLAMPRKKRAAQIGEARVPAFLLQLWDEEKLDLFTTPPHPDLCKLCTRIGEAARGRRAPLAMKEVLWDEG